MEAGEDDQEVTAKHLVPGQISPLPVDTEEHNRSQHLMNGDSPEAPLDILVVGGGPTGTAAAWRAHELGLSVLVIDRDGMLSIVKQWADNQPKATKVDADYGDLVSFISHMRDRARERGVELFVVNTGDLVDGTLDCP